jgi:hypothetical protein
MKKVKIMLMSLAVLAIVGGALAFKTTKFNVNLCTTLPETYVIPGSGGQTTLICPGDPRWDVTMPQEVCPDQFIGSTTGQPQDKVADDICVKETFVDCDQIVNCPKEDLYLD